MFCPKCAEQNPDEAQFCGGCGAPFPVAPYRPAPQPEPSPPLQDRPVLQSHAPVSDGLRIGIIIGTIFVPILGIIMGAVFMNDPNPNKKKVGKVWLMVGIGMAVVCCLLAGLGQMGQYSEY